jgi:GntR family transcriptional regulator, carbon starvation induced regulator
MSLTAFPSTATQADQVFDHLRGEILSCRFAPGAKIRINEIAARLDVSLGSVREALSRLSAEGMVIAQAQKDCSIAPVSEEEFVDLTNTRISIEQLCLRNATEHGDVEWETGIVAAFHRLHRIPERDPSDPAILNEKWSTAHGVFHFALVASCNSPSLLRIRANLYVQTERYRRLSVPLRREERDVDAEHKALMEAVLGRNADLACGLISDHLWRTTRILLASPILAGVDGDHS